MSEFKTCSACGERKPIAEFYVCKTGRDGHTGRCKPCYNESQRRWHHANRELRLAKKREYARSRVSELTAKRKDWARRNPDKARCGRRRQKLKRKYDLALSEYRRLLEAQGGLCAICKSQMEKAPDDGGAKIDHCHATGNVRGLLCHRCNVGLGWFNDDPSNLVAAADYIARHRLSLSVVA